MDRCQHYKNEGIKADTECHLCGRHAGVDVCVRKRLCRCCCEFGPICQACMLQVVVGNRRLRGFSAGHVGTELGLDPVLLVGPQACHRCQSQVSAWDPSLGFRSLCQEEPRLDMAGLGGPWRPQEAQRPHPNPVCSDSKGAHCNRNCPEATLATPAAACKTPRGWWGSDGRLGNHSRGPALLCPQLRALTVGGAGSRLARL